MKIIYKDGTVAECPKEEELHVIRHTAAHVMAQAIKRLYPQADFAFGPATENGFYYDGCIRRRISPSAPRPRTAFTMTSTLATPS